MKKIMIFAATAALALSSCSKEAVTGQSENTSDSVVLTATSDVTKSHLGESQTNQIPILFDASDELFVCSASGSGARFKTSANAISDDGKTASFNGTLEMTGPFCAVFPYSYADASTTAQQIVVNVPQEQVYLENSFCITSNIAAGCWAEGTSFALRSLGGCLEVSFTGQCSVKKIVLEDNDVNVALWGKCTATADAATGTFSDIAYSNDAEGRNVLIMTMEQAVVLDASTAKDFYFTVPAGAFAKGMTMKVYDEKDQLVNTVLTVKDLGVKRSGIACMAPVTVEDFTIFSGGSGTEENPYQIATVADLKKMATLVNSGIGNFATAHYLQTQDILNAALVNHIGSDNQKFSGVYDGGNFKITDITFSAPTEETGQGLFGSVIDGHLKNININGFTNNCTSKYSGVVAGTVNGGTVDNCHVKGTITLAGTQAGCVIGRNSTSTTTSNCSFEGTANFSGNASGGIAGHNAGGARIKGCTVKGTINATSSYVGGIIGMCECGQADAINGCVFDGDIVSTGSYIGGIMGRKANRAGGIVNCQANGTVSGRQYVGGILGGSYDSSDKPAITINACTNNASVTSTDDCAGGIAGYICLYKTKDPCSVVNCVNSGAVCSKGNTGGIVGYSYIRIKDGFISITNCLNSANVTGSADNAGGIVGYGNNATGAGSFKIENCENAGSVVNSELCTGGIVGFLHSKIAGSSIVVDKCVNCGDVTAKGNLGGILGYAQTEVADESPVNILNCVCRNCELTGTGAGKTGDNNYIRLGGIAGGNDNPTNYSPLNISNCASFGVNYVSLLETTGSIRGIAGIVGSTYKTNVNCVYSSMVDADFHTTKTATGYNGAIAGYTSDCDFKNVWYDASFRPGGGSKGTGVSATGITTVQFTDGILLGYLNAAKAGVEGAAEWVGDADGFPVPEGIGYQEIVQQ